MNMKTKKLIAFCVGMLMSIAAYGQYVGQTFTANTVEGVEMIFSITSITDNTVKVGSGYNHAIDQSTVGCITIPATVTYGGVTYQVTSIGGYAFSGCSSLTSITLSSTEIVLLGSTSAISRTMSIFVPSNLIDSYKSAENWSDINSQLIPIGSQTVWDITLTPSGTSSAVMNAIGEENLANVMDLKITGNINGYDIFIMRNQMPNLHKLDMSNASIKASSDNFCYYSTYYMKDNELGAYAFYQQSKLVDVILPQNIISIGSYAFQESKLSKINIPEGVVSIGDQAFYYCSNLTSVILPSTLKTIGSWAFCSCGIKNLSLPSTLQSIGYHAFNGCGSLSELTLPAGLKTIDSGAFNSCNNINAVKATAIDPNSVSLADDAFSTSVYANATLYIPYDETTGWNATYNAYFWHTKWGQFTNKATWKPTYDYVNIGGDYEQGTGTIPGDNIDADMGTQSGYIVGENGEQEFDDVNVDNNGTSGGSIIADGDVSVNELHCNISVTANRWYFFCFPFDIHLSANISYEGSFVWHEYDGSARATGNKGWKKMGSNAVLKAGKGYIFQGNRTGTLTIVVANPDLKRQNKNKDLDTYSASNAQNASWNFVGNPYLSYYDMDRIGFDAPITVWNGSNYDAIRPGDDDYHFQPYQAFFVQKPNGTASIAFGKEGQETYHQSQAAASNAPSRRASAINPNRKIVNLTVSDGKAVDKTRVVLNESKSCAYEMDCDASKFFSDEDVPQIYTIGGNVNYAINERPVENGTITIGFKANKDGEYTISVARMDAHCLLKDNETGVVFDLQNGDYTFSSKTGTFNQRFSLMINGETTGVAEMERMKNAENEKWYDLNGRPVQDSQKGVVIKDGQKVIMK